MPSFVLQWLVAEVWCGHRRKHRQPGGMLTVTDGVLSIEVDDDYYSGDLSAEDSLKLAREIIRQAQEG